MTTGTIPRNLTVFNLSLSMVWFVRDCVLNGATTEHHSTQPYSTQYTSTYPHIDKITITNRHFHIKTPIRNAPMCTGNWKNWHLNPVYYWDFQRIRPYANSF